MGSFSLTSDTKKGRDSPNCTTEGDDKEYWERPSLRSYEVSRSVPLSMGMQQLRVARTLSTHGTSRMMVLLRWRCLKWWCSSPQLWSSWVC